MKSFTALAFAVSLVTASPLAIRAPIVDDVYILQFALTLEHLENAFYQSALSKFDDKAFTDAGLPSFARGRAAQIGQHEGAHVAFLEKALDGKNPVKPCEYDFPFNNPKEFFDLGEAFEATGSAAYRGAAGLIQSKDILNAASSILSVEGRHAGFIKASIKKQEPWSRPFDLALDKQQVFSIASKFIKSCPSDNFDLGLNAFPALTLDPASPQPNQTIKVSFNGSDANNNGAPQYLAFITDLTPKIVEIKNGSATVPGGLQGIVFAVATKSDKDVSDASTVAGPVILDFPFNATESNA